MRRRSAVPMLGGYAPIFLTALLLASGCTAPQIENKPPYLCHVLPENSLRVAATTADEGSKIKQTVSAGPFSEAFFECVAKVGATDISYQQWQGAEVDEGREAMRSWGEDDVEYLPDNMGEGWVDLAGVGWVRWRCDARSVLSRVSYPTKRDRDQVEDIIRLLEIAQQRYAELNDCEIRPPK